MSSIVSELPLIHRSVQDVMFDLLHSLNDDELKKVVEKFGTGLGIVDELDAEMQALVDSYVCEWKEAVETPEIRERYTHFVNSEETDNNIEFVSLREQKMPKEWA